MTKTVYILLVIYFEGVSPLKLLKKMNTVKKCNMNRGYNKK